MIKTLRTKEIILIVLIIILIPTYAFYNRVIAPRWSDNTIDSNKRRIAKLVKQVEEGRNEETEKVKQKNSFRVQQVQNDERIAEMRKEADDFKQYIMNEDNEVLLYDYLFGRDARYSIVGLGNVPRRVPKGSYTEIIYQYTCRGKFPDIVKMVKKIENSSRSISISKLSLEKPKQAKDAVVADDGTVIANMEIHAIFSSLSTLTFQDFKKSDPNLDLRKIDGNPWDTEFGATQRDSEGPTGPIKRLNLLSVIYTKDPGLRTAKFKDMESWYRIGDEFTIEKGKTNTTVRLIAIGGRYVVIKHLVKNLMYKISLQVIEDKQIGRAHV